MHTKKANTTSRAPKAIGPYSQSITCASGQMIYVSGQLPLDPKTSKMPGDIAGQTEQSILNIKAILEDAGSSLANVIKTTVFLQDMNEFAVMNEVYAKYFPAPYPARAAIEVAALPKGARVEIEAVAAAGEAQGRKLDYDFETIVDRSDCGSAKWEQMKGWKPDVSPGVVPFSVADMELKNPPEIIEGLKEYLDSAILGYTMPTKGYLKVVAGWMERRHDWRIEPEWIVTSAGVVPGFYSAVRLFTGPEDGVIIQTPVYYPFYSAIEESNRTLVKNPLKFDGSKYTIDYEDLEKKASDPKNKVLLFCSPHNPIGRVWTKEELSRVGEICLRHNILIISDEIHSDLIMPGYRHTVFATLSNELADHMIVCTAPSKTFNLAGMQTSNIIIPNAEMRDTYQKDQLAHGMFGVGILGYKACEIAYTRCESWLDQLILLISHNHDELNRFMARNIPAVKVFDLEGTYLQWMDFRGLGMDKDSLEQFMHQEAELFFDEGHVFGEEGNGFERMNLACPTKTMFDALERLAATLRCAGKA